MSNHFGKGVLLNHFGDFKMFGRGKELKDKR